MLCSSLRFESQKTLHFFEIISNFILLYINMNKFEDELLGVYRSFAWYWLRVWFSDNIGKKSWVEFKHLRSAFVGCVFLLRLLAGTHGVNNIEMSLALPGLNVSLLRRLCCWRMFKLAYCSEHWRLLYRTRIARPRFTDQTRRAISNSAASELPIAAGNSS